MQEYATRKGKNVRFAEGYGPGWHVRAAASDFAAGAVLLEAGTRLTARAMIAAAAADRACIAVARRPRAAIRSEEHTSELQSLMRISYAVFCLKKKNHTKKHRS